LLEPDALHAAELFGALSIERHGAAPCVEEMLALPHNFTTYDFTTYDASYLSVARALGVPLLTADATIADARRLGVDLQDFR
jgi:predicted nucleic acid-binding protein